MEMNFYIPGFCPYCKSKVEMKSKFLEIYGGCEDYCDGTERHHCYRTVQCNKCRRNREEIVEYTVCGCILDGGNNLDVPDNYKQKFIKIVYSLL